MITRWMLQSATIGILLALAAWGAESALRVAGRQIRWIWFVALLFTVGLSALTPWRHAAEANVGVAQRGSLLDESALLRLESRGASSLVSATLNSATRIVEKIVDWSLAPARLLWSSVSSATAHADVWLAVGWLLLTIGVGVVLIIVYTRFVRSRRFWPVAYLQGIRVRISTMVGPAVMGVTHAEIIVPQWLLARDAREQQLVLDHESEHLRARDPLLLAASCAMAVVLPWHPAVWWMLARLRLAVELDCDRRLLRRGVSKRAYGNLLIELTGHRPGLRFASPAFACSASHLERRLLDMTASRPRYRAARVALVSALSLFGVLVACEANLPTAAHVKELDVASAEKQAGRLALVAKADVAYTIDDEPATEQAARALPARDIASIEVLKATHGEPSRVRVTSVGYTVAKSHAVRADSASERGYAFLTQPSSTERRGDSVMTVRFRPTAAKQQFEGLLVVDDVIVEGSALDRIAKDDIESVEVVKGHAATSKYSDPRAANGVILLKTKLKKLELTNVLRLSKEHLDQQPVPPSVRK